MKLYSYPNFCSLRYPNKKVLIIHEFVPSYSIFSYWQQQLPSTVTVSFLIQQKSQTWGVRQRSKKQNMRKAEKKIAIFQQRNQNHRKDKNHPVPLRV